MNIYRDLSITPSREPQVFILCILYYLYVCFELSDSLRASLFMIIYNRYNKGFFKNCIAGLQNSVSPNLSPVDVASLAAAMRMGNNGDMGGAGQGSTGTPGQQQGVQSSGTEQALRLQQAEALLRSQAEHALRLAVIKLPLLIQLSLI